MHRIPGVALLQFRFPLIEQGQRLLWIAYFVAQIVRYPAVGINIVEMLMQMFGQKPGHDREIFVMRVRQPRTIVLRFLERRRPLRYGVLRRQRLPTNGRRRIGLRKILAIMSGNRRHQEDCIGYCPALAKGRLERGTQALDEGLTTSDRQLTTDNWAMFPE